MSVDICSTRSLFVCWAFESSAAPQQTIIHHLIHFPLRPRFVLALLSVFAQRGGLFADSQG
jgi:hypothetical protein